MAFRAGRLAIDRDDMHVSMRLHGILDHRIEKVELPESTCFAIMLAQLLVWLQVGSTKRSPIRSDGSPGLLVHVVPQNLLGSSDKVGIAGVQSPAISIWIHPKGQS